MNAPDFGTLAGPYARYRSGYPPELFARILAAAPAKAKLDALDVASGTGMSAAGLADRAARLVAVDIARPMLQASRVPARALARAEQLPFRDARFDLVTCAQAFHWFDAPRAYAEMHRVLRPEGLAALWWKYEAADDPVAQLCDAIVANHLGRPAPHTDMARDAPLPPGPFRVEEERLRHIVPFTAESYVGYHASREILRQAAGPKREPILRELRAALDARHGEAAFDVAYVSRLCLLRKA